MPTAPLANIRVIDFSRVLAGPLVAQMLGDLGAEVIKIERPGGGDDSRQYGPPFFGGEAGRRAGESAFFIGCNRGKKSVTLDIASKRGRAIARDLTARADVVVENFRVGTLARYGLDYHSLAAGNPGLVYCSITGYGQTGPDREKPGYDAIFQGKSGLMSMTGLPDGEPGGGPMKVGPSIVDILTSLYASTAVVTALLHRPANGGRGQHIDMALLDCGIAALSHYAEQYLVSGVQPPRRGTAGNGGLPSQMFVCGDGRGIMITVGNDLQWQRFCRAAGRTDLLEDPRYATSVPRIENRDTLIPMLHVEFATRTAAEWLKLLEEAEIPSGPINDLDAVFADPQVVHRGMKQPAPHPLATGLEVLTNPLRFSDALVRSDKPSPMLGQHTDEVLGGLLGIGSAEIAELRAAGVV
ncbi:MAG: CaiB/BaiF CoA transferase family protein [Gammaproteobacteria bacterium]